MYNIKNVHSSTHYSIIKSLSIRKYIFVYRLHISKFRLYASERISAYRFGLASELKTLKVKHRVVPELVISFRLAGDLVDAAVARTYGRRP